MSSNKMAGQSLSPPPCSELTRLTSTRWLTARPLSVHLARPLPVTHQFKTIVAAVGCCWSHTGATQDNIAISRSIKRVTVCSWNKKSQPCTPLHTDHCTCMLSLCLCWCHSFQLADGMYRETNLFCNPHCKILVLCTMYIYIYIC